MTRIRTSLLVAASILLPAVVWAVQVGQPAPAFSLPPVAGGENVTLESMKGKVVVLDFWASWCRPCIKAFPELSSIQQHYGAKGVKVITVSIDEEVASARAKIGKGQQFLPLHDGDQAVAERYGVGDSLPATIVIDRTGTVRFAKIGGSVPPAKLRQVIESLL